MFSKAKWKIASSYSNVVIRNISNLNIQTLYHLFNSVALQQSNGEIRNLIQ